MVSSEKGLPTKWDPKTGLNVKWSVDLGSQSYAGPIIADGQVYVGTNNDVPRDPRYKGDRSCVYCLDEKTGEPIRNSDGSFAAKTSHTLNPVPCIFYHNRTAGPLTVRPDPELGLSNLAATIVNLLGFEAPEAWDRGILQFDGGAEVGTIR